MYRQKLNYRFWRFIWVKGNALARYAGKQMLRIAHDWDEKEMLKWA